MRLGGRPRHVEDLANPRVGHRRERRPLLLARHRETLFEGGARRLHVAELAPGEAARLECGGQLARVDPRPGHMDGAVE